MWNDKLISAVYAQKKKVRGIRPVSYRHGTSRWSKKSGGDQGLVSVILQRVYGNGWYCTVIGSNGLLLRRVSPNTLG